MTEKNTSLNATNFEILTRGLNDEKATVNGNMVTFERDGKATTTFLQSDMLAYINGSKSDKLVGHVKAPMLHKLCEDVVPIGYSYHNSEDFMNMIKNGEYSRLFNDMYSSVDEKQIAHCKEVVDYFQEKFGKENVKMLEEGISNAERNRTQERDASTRAFDNADVKVMLRSKR